MWYVVLYPLWFCSSFDHSLQVLSEKYRNTLRNKDQELKHAEGLAAAHQNDLIKVRPFVVVEESISD